MNAKLKLYLLNVLIILSSCKKDKTHPDFYVKSIPNKDKIVNIITKYHLIKKIDSTLINRSEKIILQQAKQLNDSIVYFTYNYNKFAKLNTKNNKIHSIVLPKEIDGTIISFDVVNKDSIFFGQNMPTKLYLFKPNTKNKIEIFPLKKIKFKTDNFFFNQRTNTALFKGENYNLDFNNLFYDKKLKNLIIGIDPFDAHILSGFENTNRLGIYSLLDKKWIKLYGKPKGIIALRRDFSFGNNFLSFKDILIKGDTSFIHYKINHKISCYINNRFYKEINFCSKKSKKIFKPLNQKDVYDIEKNKALFYATPFYKGIFYHKKNKIYTRFYLDQQEPFDDLGKYNTNSNREIYIIFLDENFNYVGEQKLKNFTPKNIIPTKDGFLIIKNVENKNYLYRYVIKKI